MIPHEMVCKTSRVENVTKFVSRADKNDLPKNCNFAHVVQRHEQVRGVALLRS